MLEIEDDILSEVIGSKEYHKRAPRFGERAWKAEGKEVDVIYWDTGNGWCDILLVTTKECKECRTKLERFYKRSQQAIVKNYDEDICRID